MVMFLACVYVNVQKEQQRDGKLISLGKIWKKRIIRKTKSRLALRFLYVPNFHHGHIFCISLPVFMTSQNVLWFFLHQDPGRRAYPSWVTDAASQHYPKESLLLCWCPRPGAPLGLLPESPRSLPQQTRPLCSVGNGGLWLLVHICVRELNAGGFEGL